MVQIIEVGTPAYNNLIIEAALAGARAVREDSKRQDDFITQAEAMELIKVKSNAKMKRIREETNIVYKKVGRDFRYSRRSLERWLSGA